MDLLALPWLPPAPDDFRDQVRALRRSAPTSIAALRRLATHRLDTTQLSLLERACQQQALAGAGPLRLRVLSNASTELCNSALVATAPRHGLLLDVSSPSFGSWMQEALDPASTTAASRPHAVLLALDWRAYDLTPCPGHQALAEQRVQAAVDQLLGAAQALVHHAGCQVLVQTLVEPPGSLFGSTDIRIPGTQRWMVQRFNQALVDQLTPALLLLDLANVAAQVGSARWHDPGLWQLGKFPMATQAVPLYADHVCRVLMASRGLARKCLVLDLDNTIWGGVVGDDGVGGIQIGQGSALGEAFLAVQSLALALRERGVILAVCSKNDENIARQALREHPDMLLREHHIAAFFANWNDKASNLAAIAAHLDIGTDALVFLDDNPSERHQVRNALPEVAVPELPASAEHYAGILEAAGYFESVQFTDDDRRRAEQYQMRAAQSAQLAAGGDIEAHLASLEMVAEFSAFDALGRSRIAQLINKTNQFNLTTRRSNEAEVEALQADPQALTMQVRLKDRFGDNGMVCVVVGRQTGSTLEVETWLMSCRVLKRGLEQAVLNELVAQAAARGVATITGWFHPTAKNGLVRDHYPTLGFRPLGRVPGSQGESTHWGLDIEGFTPLPCQVRAARTTPAGATAG